MSLFKEKALFEAKKIIDELLKKEAIINTDGLTDPDSPALKLVAKSLEETEEMLMSKEWQTLYSNDEFLKQPIREAQAYLALMSFFDKGLAHYRKKHSVPPEPTHQQSKGKNSYLYLVANNG